MNSPGWIRTTRISPSESSRAPNHPWSTNNPRRAAVSISYQGENRLVDGFLRMLRFEPRQLQAPADAPEAAVPPPARLNRAMAR